MTREFLIDGKESKNLTALTCCTLSGHHLIIRLRLNHPCHHHTLFRQIFVYIFLLAKPLNTKQLLILFQNFHFFPSQKVTGWNLICNPLRGLAVIFWLQADTKAWDAKHGQGRSMIKLSKWFFNKREGSRKAKYPKGNLFRKHNPPACVMFKTTIAWTR